MKQPPTARLRLKYDPVIRSTISLSQLAITLSLTRGFTRPASRPATVGCRVGWLPLPLLALQPPAAIERAAARRRVAGLLPRIVVVNTHSLTYLLI